MNGEEDAGEVVEALALALGCELLAVVSFDQVTSPLSLAGVENSDLTRASLPYAVPTER